MDLKNELISLAIKNNIDKIGFTPLVFDENYKKLENELKQKEYLTTFHKEYKIDEYKEYKSVVVILVNYYNEKIKEVSKLDKKYAHFSLSSWGKDYHIVLKEKLIPLKEYLESKGYNAKICIDSHELSERNLAINAGLGFTGINGSLINEELGSFVFIGLLLTDAVFSYDEKTNKECYKCMKCMKACPTKSIKGNGSINGNTCLSYITQKKSITKEEMSLINNCIYGCDICSLVCPYNQNLNTNNNFTPLGVEVIDVLEYKPLTNKEFKDKYGLLSGSWRGKRVIERNISIIKEKLENK